MATACWKHLSFVVEILRELQPQSVLDVGTGFGKYGFLAREYLDIYNYRIARQDWGIRLEGIEGYEPYLLGHQQQIYDALHLGDACEVLPRLVQYDMVIAGDVVEHQEKPKALALLQAMREHARRWVLVSIPLGKAWPQEEYKDNRFDAHRSHWSSGELRRLGFAVYRFRDEEMRPYGVGLLTQPGAPRFRRSRVWFHALVHAIENRFPATRTLHERLQHRGGPAGGPES